jgi:choline dehydrogenase
MVQQYHGNVDMKDGLSLMPIVLHPRSAGTVRLRSSNAADAPVIDPKLLSVKEDVNTAVEGK